MKKLMLLMGLTACATPGTMEFRTERLTGETSEYNVNVFERSFNGLCRLREITLRERSGLHIGQHHVSYVKATDRNCDDVFDQFYFRDSRDERVDREFLTGTLLHIYDMLRTKR